MVSFSCEVCGETVPKKKCEKHFRRCPDAYFTCLDCQKTFYGNDYIKHTSCISEAEKYQKGLYRGKKNKKKTNQIKVQQDKKKSEAPKGTGKDNTKFSVAKYLKKNHKKSLYQVFKDVKKNDKSIKDKKQFLKLLKVNLDDNGILTISL